MRIAKAGETFLADVPNKDLVHYPDVQGYVQQELDAAYNFLVDAQHNYERGQTKIDLWRFCSEPLVSAIQGHRVSEITALRNAFEEDAKTLGLAANWDEDVTHFYAWAILVDSALLNAQLVHDMKDAPSARRGNFVLPTEWMPYFLPEPPEPAKQAFMEYVRCRWPIHVFALDPEAEIQNISDTYNSRREMQLAMSLAFVSGQISADNMMRYARRLETEMETISLNNTMVGFSYGENTFGWRFYPRYQTPDTPNNMTALFRDLICGGPSRNDLLRERRLEPGIRECVAIVLMPSFVPYADIDSSSNWFALDRPRRKLLDNRRAVQLGERVRFIENTAPRSVTRHAAATASWNACRGRLSSWPPACPASPSPCKSPTRTRWAGSPCSTAA